MLELIRVATLGVNAVNSVLELGSCILEADCKRLDKLSEDLHEELIRLRIKNLKELSSKLDDRFNEAVLNGELDDELIDRYNELSEGISAVVNCLEVAPEELDSDEVEEYMELITEAVDTFYND